MLWRWRGFSPSPLTPLSLRELIGIAVTGAYVSGMWREAMTAPPFSYERTLSLRALVAYPQAVGLVVAGGAGAVGAP